MTDSIRTALLHISDQVASASQFDSELERMQATYEQRFEAMAGRVQQIGQMAHEALLAGEDEEGEAG